MEITKQQITAIQTIINKDANLKSAKEDIIMEASKGRTISVKELTFPEAKELVSALMKIQPAKKIDKDDPCHKMRGKILSHAHTLGWHKKDKDGITIRDPATQKPKIDFDRVNEWCTKFGYLHKRIDKYTYSELPTLVSQFENVVNNYLNKF